jgi:hypothetical protein
MQVIYTYIPETNYVTYFLNEFEIVPIDPIITAITFDFTFHMRCITIVRSLYFRIFSASFLITFLFHEIATSININVIIIMIIIISYSSSSSIIIISFMQGIYTYIPETNDVPTEYSVAAILLLLFMVLISLVTVLNLLYFYVSTFRSMCAVPNMSVFCSSLTS